MNKLPVLERGKMEEGSVRTWTRPEIRRLCAGAAELGGGLNVDVGFGKS
jgi:hypothetical protein